MLKIFQKLLGKKYLLNKTTGEVHKLKKITKACGVHNMAKKNKAYLNEKQYQHVIVSGEFINGCVHCFKETDTD